MYNCFMMVFTVLSCLGAVGAMFVAIFVYRRQRKIALFDRRMKILDDFEKFVFKIMPDWDWQGDLDYITKYSDQEVLVLFNVEYLDLKNNILKTANTIKSLIGDLNYARNHGNCHNKTEDELEKEILSLQEILQKQFTLAKEQAYQKWFKI